MLAVIVAENFSSILTHHSRVTGDLMNCSRQRISRGLCKYLVLSLEKILFGNLSFFPLMLLLIPINSSGIISDDVDASLISNFAIVVDVYYVIVFEYFSKRFPCWMVCHVGGCDMRLRHWVKIKILPHATAKTCQSSRARLRAHNSFFWRLIE